SQVSAQAGEHCRPFSNGIVYDCGNNNDAFHIKDVILNEKPVKGKPLNIHLIGELNEKVKFGSKTFIKAFYNGMKVLDLDKDICELVQRNTRYKCPIKPQKKFNFNQTLVIPSYAP
ncbi:Phosphatidylglycerol/phosphatidylinositol transfer protein, partial [Massospora cicadina]